MNNIKIKEKNLSALIDKLGSLSVSYSQSPDNNEKIKYEQDQLQKEKKEAEDKHNEILREHKYLKKKISKLQKEINKKSLMHVDTNLENIKTAVFYCNDNNGYTFFQNGKKVSSKANRIVIFDGHQKHCGVDCTDENVRVVINFNYFEKK